MESRVMCSSNQNNLEAKVERDLWNALLQAEGIRCDWHPDQPLTEGLITVSEQPTARIGYPWNPAESEADVFWDKTEQDSIFQDWPSEEVATRAESFFTQLDTLFAAAASTSLETTLAQRFAACVPQSLLSTIAAQAQRLSETSLSLADQLVQCVQELLPNFTDLLEEDLYVLARPLAFALRDPQSQAVESSLEMIRSVRWEELSHTEQARLSLTIARYALSQLEREADQ